MEHLPLPPDWDGNGVRKAWKSEGMFESETAPLPLSLSKKAKFFC